MNWNLLSAGSTKISRQILLLFSLLCFACQPKTPEKDPELERLRIEVKRLSEENARLTEEIRTLRVQSQPAVPHTSTPEPQKEEMTVETMKLGVQPVLKEVIEKIKKSSETPSKNNQYGMRIEYDLKNAVYGLVNSSMDDVPAAKVIVKYEKYLESEKDSRSYGSGSTTFLFVYQNNQWLLSTYQ